VLDLTPRELDAYSDGVLRRKDSETILLYKHAHWTAAWINGEKPEELDKLLCMKRQRVEMTDEQMFEQVKKLNVVLGGE
jgi:hypothetical protein